MINSRQFLEIWGRARSRDRVKVTAGAKARALNLERRVYINPVKVRIKKGCVGIRCQIWPLAEKAKGIRKVVKKMVKGKNAEERNNPSGRVRIAGRNQIPMPFETYVLVKRIFLR